MYVHIDECKNEIEEVSGLDETYLRTSLSEKKTGVKEQEKRFRILERITDQNTGGKE